MLCHTSPLFSNVWFGIQPLTYVIYTAPIRPLGWQQKPINGVNYLKNLSVFLSHTLFNVIPDITLTCNLNILVTELCQVVSISSGIHTHHDAVAQDGCRAWMGSLGYHPSHGTCTSYTKQSAYIIIIFHYYFFINNENYD